MAWTRDEHLLLFGLKWPLTKKSTLYILLSGAPLFTMPSTKSCDLFPDELLHLVLAQLLFVDYDMFSHRSPVQLLTRRAEATPFSLVCQRWRRVAVPIMYETVILTSESEAKTLVSMLRLRRVGPYIRKLRMEGGYGHSIHAILSKIPGLTFISVSLDILSKQKADGLCSGLKFINPKHVVLRDPKTRGHEGVSNVIDVLIECMTSVWSNLVSYDHPYDDYMWFDDVSGGLGHRARRTRAVALARSLARIPKLQTVYVPRSYSVPEDGVVLSAIKNHSLQRIYGRFYWIPGLSNFELDLSNFELALETHPRLREVVHLRLPGPWTSPIYVAIGDRDCSELSSTFAP